MININNFTTSRFDNFDINLVQKEVGGGVVTVSQIDNRRLDYLPVAMQMLRADYPEGYFLIRDYYYNQDKVSMMYLASKYGMTFEAVRYRIDRAKELLKDYITLHENI